MSTHFDTVLRTQLVTRRQRLESAIAAASGREYLADLLREVDAALFRLDTGTFGLCETCHEPIEGDRLAADPLVRLCIEHLTPPQQRALEEDLELASRIQSGLRPRNGGCHNGTGRGIPFRCAERRRSDRDGDRAHRIAANGIIALTHRTH